MSHTTVRETAEHVEGPGKMFFPATAVAVLSVLTVAFLLWMHNTTYQDPRNPVSQHPSSAQTNSH